MNTILLLGEAVWVSIVGGVVSLISLAMTLLIKQGQEKLRTEINGKMTSLLEAKQAQGVGEGIEQARLHQVEKDDKQAVRDAGNKPQAVTIVEQKEEIPVTVKKDETKG